MKLEEILKTMSEKYSNNLPLRAIVSLIPNVGSFIDITGSWKWETYKENRINDFMIKVEHELSTIKSENVNREFLQSEEFFDIIYSIFKDIIGSRLPEKRAAYAKIVKDAVEQKENVSSIEALIEQVGNLKEKDLVFLARINEYKDTTPDESVVFTGKELSNFINDEQNFNQEEVTRLLFRFAYLGLLDYKTNVLTLREYIKFSKTNLFDKLFLYFYN